jgi:hypothetical protein
MVVVPLLALALLITACDAGGSQPVPGEATRSTSTPTGTSTGANLPDALLTEVLSTAGTATPAAIPTSLSEDDRQTIFGLVVLNLVKAESATTVYLNPFLGQGERLDETDPAKSLGDGLGKYMDAVDGERQYFMSGFSEAVGALEEGGKVKDSGVFVTLGEIMSGPEGTGIVAVRGTIYRGLGNAAGYLYSFQPDATAPDGWKLLDVQQEWSDN